MEKSNIIALLDSLYNKDLAKFYSLDKFVSDSLSLKDNDLVFQTLSNLVHNNLESCKEDLKFTFDNSTAIEIKKDHFFNYELSMLITSDCNLVLLSILARLLYQDRAYDYDVKLIKDNLDFSVDQTCIINGYGTEIYNVEYSLLHYILDLYKKI